MRVRLFTTLGCHLCEQALAQLHLLQDEGLALDIHEVEIADSDELIEQYGIRVPVVAKDNDLEIGWPFSVAELDAFLRAS